MDNRDKALIELLEKWRNGHFTQTDELALKTLAREGDAFAKEAIEGMLSTPEQAHDRVYQRLKGRLASRTRPKGYRNRYAAAAAFAVLCVAVWWMWPRTQHGAGEGAIVSVPLPSDTNMPAVASPEERANMAKKMPQIAQRTPSKKAEDAYSDSSVAAVGDDGIRQVDHIPVAEAKDMPVLMPTITSAPDPSRILRNAAPPDTPEAGDIPAEAAVSADFSKAKEASKSSPEPAEYKAAKKVMTQQRAKASNEPSPLVGWNRFRADMSALTLPDEAKVQGLSRLSASLQLDINPITGAIEQVTVLRKAGFGCDARAEAFVRDYLWTVPRGNTGSVVVEVEFR